MPNSALVYKLQDIRAYDGLGVAWYADVLDISLAWPRPTSSTSCTPPAGTRPSTASVRIGATVSGVALALLGVWTVLGDRRQRPVPSPPAPAV